MKRKAKHSGKGRKHIRNIIIGVLSVIFIFSGFIFVYADQMLNKIHYIPDNPAEAASSEPVSQPQPVSQAGSSSQPEQDQIYHDSAVQNILLLGVDDYQENDAGRSDSMLLVSVDNRHKKLKLTSFMRDMYVAIPGHSSNKLNAAYHFAGGGAAGAGLCVQTIEDSFRVGIDHYVIVSNSAFDKIVDRLGGVTVTITQEEANLINRYSGDRRRNLKAGTFNLSGKQAHYYSRIRAIGDDFGRTERQRKVFISVADKFKTQNIGTIYSVLSDTLGLVTTNMSKNEVLSLAGSALTYLNYPITQDRIPAEGEYYADNLTVGNVLVPDLDAARRRLSDFIYESRAAAKAAA